MILGKFRLLSQDSFCVSLLVIIYYLHMRFVIVCGLFEYSSIIWSPCYKNGISKIEAVQVTLFLSYIKQLVNFSSVTFSFYATHQYLEFIS